MLLAYILTAILAALAVFQVALAAGAPWGRLAWGGQHRVLPKKLRIGSIVSVVIYALIATIALDRAGAIDILPEAFSRVVMWVIFAYFTIGIMMNLISRSNPERYTMTPLTIVLAVLSFFIAMGSQI